MEKEFKTLNEEIIPKQYTDGQYDMIIVERVKDCIKRIKEEIDYELKGGMSLGNHIKAIIDKHTGFKEGEK